MIKTLYSLEIDNRKIYMEGRCSKSLPCCICSRTDQWWNQLVVLIPWCNFSIMVIEFELEKLFHHGIQNAFSSLLFKICMLLICFPFFTTIELDNVTAALGEPANMAVSRCRFNTCRQRMPEIGPLHRNNPWCPISGATSPSWSSSLNLTNCVITVFST